MAMTFKMENGLKQDDLIGTLAKQAEKEGYQVFMMTPDKDFGQLVSENIFIYNLRSGNPSEMLGPKKFVKNLKLKGQNKLLIF